MISWLPKKRVNHDAVKKLLSLSDENGQYTNRGPVVSLLESKFSRMMGIDDSKSVIAVSNGTSAIQAVIGLLARRLGRLPKIATQAFTFPSSAMQYASSAIILDIDPLTGGPQIDSIHPDTEVLIVTNVFGRCVDPKVYEDFCRSRGIFLLFDNAASPLTFVDGKNISNFGDASIVSLHHTKTVGFGEGGLVIIDKQYKEEIIDITGFGLGKDRSTWCKFALNARMSDVAASYILQYVEENESNFVSLGKAQKEFMLRANVPFFPSAKCSMQVHTSIPILCDLEVQKRFIESGIEVKKYYKPLTAAKNSLKMFDMILNLPSHVDMVSDDYEIYLELLK